MARDNYGYFFLFALLYLISNFSYLAIGFHNITTDESTLLVLKSHIITNSDHVLAKNWSTTTSVCNWIGIKCGSRHHRVIELNISNMGLTGTIPGQLGNLSFLTTLDMSSNNFHGRLPLQLSGLRRLRSIILRDNNFAGDIPPSLSNLSKLEFLELSSNLFEGMIPQEIGNLSNLEFFRIANNKLTGVIPQQITSLHKLKALQLDNNSLSGSIPEGIFNISTLRVITLGHNNLSGSLPPDMCHKLPNLQELFLNSNSLTGQIPAYISNSSELTIISLQHNEFTGPIPNSFGDLRLLSCLHLYGNNLVTSNSSRELSFITSLTNCLYLTDLSISDNPLDGVLPASIGNMSSLIRFYASNCKIIGNIPNEIGNLSDLVMLALHNNYLSGFVPATFVGLKSLQGLILRNNKIQGPFPNSLCSLHKLNTLSLGQNEISSPIPHCLGNVASLRKIYLNSNRFSSSIPYSLWNLKDLLMLDLSRNYLSGVLPQQVENLKAASSIDLSENLFSGEIPITLGSLQSLVNLSLASNKLEGSIPESFANMISMEYLDLSNNSLSQEIPKSIERLHYLKYFNVSFNKLRGEIPSGGPFKTFTYQFFLSNEALCGAPQFQIPPCHYRSSVWSRTKGLFLVISLIIASLILTIILVLLWIMKQKRKEIQRPSKADSLGRFSYQLIQQATDFFSQGNLLGTGSFGSVYRATFENGKLLAVKVFNLQVENAFKSFETECKILGNLRHRNLTKVISVCSNLDFKALLLEYMENGSLEDWLYSESRFLNIMQRLDIMIDVASALEYLHHGYHTLVIHCDLKPSNILLDKDMVGRVSDFGIAKLLENEGSNVHTKTLATLGYIAPEYGIEGLVSSACDVYSYGILLIETFTRRRPSDNMFDGDLTMKSWICALLPNGLSQAVDPNLLRGKECFTKNVQLVSWIIELALNCVAESPKDRMDMKDILAKLMKIKVQFIAMLHSVDKQ